MIKQIRASYSNNKKNAQYCALSTDNLPNYLKNGDEVYFIDTGKSYIYNEQTGELVEGTLSGGGASSLAELSDVDLTGVAAGDGIIFDGQKFKPAQYFPVYNDPSYIAVGVELDNSELSGLLTGKPFILLDATILDDNDDVLTSNDISFVRPTVYDSKLHDFEIFGVMADDGRNENTGLYYIAYVEMESDGKTIKTVTNRYTNQPLAITITPTSADLSTGTVSGATYAQIRAAVLGGRKVQATIDGQGGVFEINCYDNAGVAGIAVGPNPFSSGFVLFHVYIHQNGAIAHMFPLASS